ILVDLTLAYDDPVGHKGQGRLQGWQSKKGRCQDSQSNKAGVKAGA
ncbi:hypothetical protein INT45_008384, partial [Circinella minor]